MHAVLQLIAGPYIIIITHFIHESLTNLLHVEVSSSSVMNVFLLFTALFLIMKPIRIYCKVFVPFSSRYRPGICEFPSLYKDKVIKQCQLGEDGQWWCPKDDNYELYNQRTLCPNTSFTYAGNDPGQFCHFPFIYNGKEYWTCIRSAEDEHQKRYWWCSTTADYDKDRTKRWTRCKEQSQQLPCFFKEEGGSGISGECRHFSDKWVCHTENNEIRECPRTSSTYGGNQPGEACHFPFIFREKEYRSCISAKRSDSQHYGNDDLFESYLWCSTTDNYNVHRRWTKCKEEESFFRLTDRRVIIPVSVILGILTLVLCLATLLHFFCNNSPSHKYDCYNHRPCLHISMLDLATADLVTLPSAPPSYLEAVMTVNDQS